MQRQRVPRPTVPRANMLVPPPSTRVRDDKLFDLRRTEVLSASLVAVSGGSGHGHYVITPCSFPFAASVAARFSMYEMLSFTITYQPTCAATLPGRIGFMFASSPSTSTTLTYDTIAQGQPAVTGNVRDVMRLNVNPMYFSDPRKKSLAIQAGDPTTAQEGLVLYAYDGVTGGGTMGTLEVTYHFRFWNPVPATVGSNARALFNVEVDAVSTDIESLCKTVVSSSLGQLACVAIGQTGRWIGKRISDVIFRGSGSRVNGDESCIQILASGYYNVDLSVGGEWQYATTANGPWMSVYDAQSFTYILPGMFNTHATGGIRVGTKDGSEVWLENLPGAKYKYWGMRPYSPGFQALEIGFTAWLEAGEYFYPARIATQIGEDTYWCRLHSRDYAYTMPIEGGGANAGGCAIEISAEPTNFFPDPSSVLPGPESGIVPVGRRGFARSTHLLFSAPAAPIPSGVSVATSSSLPPPPRVPLTPRRNPDPVRQ